MPKKLPTHQQLNRVLFNVVSKAWREAQEQVGEQYAPQIVADIRARIFGQRFDHVPLNPDYLAWKVKKGYDERTLIQTSQYVNAIRWWKLPSGEIAIGVPRYFYHHSGLPMIELARIHEYGSAAAHIPARPHWRPVMRYWKRHLPNEFQRQFSWSLVKLRKGIDL